MSAAEHAARNLEQIAFLQEGLLGSGFTPSVWCLNLACHAPIRADAVLCPECGVPTRARPRTLDGRALTLLLTFRTLRTRVIAHGLNLPYDTTVAVLRALEEQGAVRACAGRWQLTGGQG